MIPIGVLARSRTRGVPSPTAPSPSPPSDDTGGIDAAESLSAGLLWAVFAGDHPGRERVTGTSLSLLGDAALSGATDDGPALEIFGTADGAYSTPAAGWASLGTAYTLFLDIDPSDWPDFAKLFAVPYHDESWSAPFGLLLDTRTGNDRVRLGYASNAGTLHLAESDGGLIEPGVRQQIALVRDGGQVRFYRNGALHSTDIYSVNVAPDLGAAPAVVALNRHPANPGEGVTGKLPGGLFWSRALTAGEIAALADDARRLIDDGTAAAPFVADVNASAVVGGDPVAIPVLPECAYRAGAVVTVLDSPALAGAEVVVDGQDRVVYTPPADGAGGSETLTYRVEDDGGSTTGTVVVVVSSGDEPPPPPPPEGAIWIATTYGANRAPENWFNLHGPPPTHIAFGDRWNFESNMNHLRQNWPNYLILRTIPISGGANEDNSSWTVQQTANFMISKLDGSGPAGGWDGITLDEFSPASQNIAKVQRYLDAFPLVKAARPGKLICPYHTPNTVRSEVWAAMQASHFDYLLYEAYQGCVTSSHDQTNVIEAGINAARAQGDHIVRRTLFYLNGGWGNDSGCGQQNCMGPNAQQFHNQMAKVKELAPDCLGVGIARNSCGTTQFFSQWEQSIRSLWAERITW